jgi:hypothetical protein
VAGTDGAFLERLLRALAAPATAALLAACGSSAVPPMGSTTTAGPTTTAQGVPPCGVVESAQVVVTPGQELCVATTHVGATIRIVLDPGFHWDDPRSDSDAIQVGSIQRPPGGALEADLHAVAVGQATVTTVGTVTCAPGQPCPALARLWKLHITVTQSSSSLQTITATQAGSGHRYTLHNGDRLDVKLSGPSNYTWTEPASSEQGVLQQVSGSSGSTASASFLAVGTGNAMVTASDNPGCYPRCLAPSRLFAVNVSVTG